MSVGTKLAAYRYEIHRLHERSDDLCVAVSALLRYVARRNAAHAEDACSNVGTGPCPSCASYVEEIVRLKAGTDSADQGADQALKWAAQALNERDGEVRGLKAEMAEKDDAIEWLRAEVDKIKQDLEKRRGRLKRYENATTSGRHGYNEERAVIRAEELKKFAEENGIEIVENRKIGPPEGHEGVHHEMHVEKTVHHEMRVPPPWVQQQTPEAAARDIQTNTRF